MAKLPCARLRALRRTQVVCALCCLLLVFSLGSVGSAASLSADAYPASVQPGETCSIEVSIGGLQSGMVAIQMDVTYDSDRFTYRSASSAVSGRGWSLTANDTGAGSVRVVLENENLSSYSGGGLFSLSFIANDGAPDGSGSFSLSGARVSDESGNSISASGSSAQVSVQTAVQTAAPAPTQTPARTATPSATAQPATSPTASPGAQATSTASGAPATSPSASIAFATPDAVNTGNTGNTGNTVNTGNTGNTGTISSLSPIYAALSSGTTATNALPTQSAAAPSTTGVVVNCEESVNVRYAPDAAASLLGVAKLGEVYPVWDTTANRGYYHIDFNGTDGYILADYLSVAAAPSASPATSAFPAQSDSSETLPAASALAQVRAAGDGNVFLIVAIVAAALAVAGLVYYFILGSRQKRRGGKKTPPRRR